MTTQYIHTFATYNCWANGTLSAFICGQAPGLADNTMSSSFPSIKETFIHIHSAETIWLSRLQESIPGADWMIHPKNRIDEVTEKLNQQSTDLKHYVSSLDEFTLGSTIHYKTSGGIAYQHRCLDVLIHCFNHSTYHRGQVVTMMNQLHLENLPQTDYIFFLRKIGMQRN
jgi:uncharacterized damage-inducible protein DinB